MSYPIQIRLASKNGYHTPAEAKAYYGRYSRSGITWHWWNTPNLVKDSDHDNICNYILGKASRGEGSVNYVLSNNKITLIVNPDNVAWASQSGNPVTVSVELSPHLNAEGYKKAGWLKNELEGRYGKTLKSYKHSDWFGTQCLPVETTELLTKNGWKLLKDMQIGDDVATPHIDDMSISFSPVRNVVEPYLSDTWLSRGVEATADHNMVYTTKSRKSYRIKPWGEVRQEHMAYIPNAGNFLGEGLELSNDELIFLCAVQADGHYMREYRQESKPRYGVEFHLKKQRKIEQIIDIIDSLDIEFNTNKKSDGTVSLRMYNNKSNNNYYMSLIDKWLDNKMFSWEWLNMSSEQYNIFSDIILDFDGCRTGNDYSSSNRQNIDVVTALSTLHGVGTREQNDKRVTFTKGHRWVGKESESKRISQKLVGCVTVDTGLILIRQNGRTTIVGNCPGTINVPKIDQEAAKWKSGAYNPKPVPKPIPTPIPAKPVSVVGEWTLWKEGAVSYVCNKQPTHLWNFDATTWNMQSVKQFNKGDRIDIAGSAKNVKLGSTYYVTGYSFSKKTPTGFNPADLDIYVAPRPTPKPPVKPTVPPVPKPEPVPSTPTKDEEQDKRLKVLEGALKTLQEAYNKIISWITSFKK